MLRSITPKSLKISLRSQTAYYASDDSISKSERRERLLRLRYEQKELYGYVIHGDSNDEHALHSNVNKKLKVVPVRSENAPLSPFDVINQPTTVTNVKLARKEVANEFHWLSQTSKFKILKTNKSRTKLIGRAMPFNNDDGPFNDDHKQSNETLHTSPTHQAAHSKVSNTMNPASAIITAKNLMQQIVLNNKRNHHQVIPFDDAGLKSICTYPLICEKKSMSQVEELIDDEPMRLPSISKILQSTMPDSARIALKKWKMNKIAELGADGFKQYEKETLDRGKRFHSAIENYLNTGQVPQPESPIIKFWQSIDPSLHELKPKAILLEQPILHADLKYKGIIDNVSIVNNELCAFEWKTSEKSKPRITSTYDAPVQICAYLGALNADPRYDLTVKNGFVVVAYKNGDAANVFNLSESDLRKYWLVWLQRLQEYWIRVRDGTLPDPI